MQRKPLTWQEEILQGIPDYLPDMPPVDAAVPRALKRKLVLNLAEQKQAVANALRYFPAKWHAILEPEFLNELRTLGRIYMHRFRPQFPVLARPVHEYPGQILAANSMMLMIQNNLHTQVAQYPFEMITYGGNGGVFQNWAQYRLTMWYLSKMSNRQTLVMKSGHPDGLYPSYPDSPRVVLTNGLVVPRFGTPEDYERLAQLGVTMYGQMTAGSWTYIGSQGIVHGTDITFLLAARKWLKLGVDENLKGKLIVTSGSGGMSGAQAKAAVILGAVGVIAEVKMMWLQKRHKQGWLNEIHTDLKVLSDRIREAVANGEAVSLGYHGNVVDLWEHLLVENIRVDLGSDQTSLHDAYGGGYYPSQMTVEEADALRESDAEAFKLAVQKSIRRHVIVINMHVALGMKFWDYGNSFIDVAIESGADIFDEHGQPRYQSYVEGLMGPMYFDYGFGPYRWVCLSGLDEDLATTDAIALEVIEGMIMDAPDEIKQQLKDNAQWILDAGKHKLAIGSRARILYSNAEGRVKIALAMNEAIRDGRLHGPIVISRDHHDTGGTDSFLRETSSVHDGSAPTADTSAQCVIGNAMRGATWVSYHHGGGTGWGKAMNGGFGLVLDGSPEVDLVIESMLTWDVLCGVTRRAWAGSPTANWAVRQEAARVDRFEPTLANLVDPKLLANIV